ncbi:MAG: carboxypeptidase regulatory-like domain-containing protein [Candidatus Binataceae bacterium]|nr:carboxypeptidase regulatory-like domain-containing protein [Candidatus Binataceae bacterium]
MTRKLLGTMIASLFLLATATPVLCADVVGMVSDLRGNPVPGVQIAAKTVAGKVVERALTTADGKYKLPGLDTGTYDYELNPLQTGFKGGDAVSYLDSKGITINWKLSDASNAVALATQGAGETLAGDPFGLTMGEFASVVVLGTAAAAAGAVGGYGAAGGFSSDTAHPTSSSL